MALSQRKAAASVDIQINSTPTKNKKSKTTKKSATIPQFSENDSKQDRMIALLTRPSGSTIEDLMTATGWQGHSVRGAMSGTLKKRMGLNIASIIEEHRRVYRISGDHA